MLSEIKGIGPITENKLKTLGIYTKKDLIEYLPKKYIDLSVVIDINIATEGQFCLFEGEIIDVEKPFKKGNLQIFKAIAKISNSTVNLIWFNHNFMSKTIKISQKYMIYGKLKINGKYKEIVNPICEIDDKKEELDNIKAGNKLGDINELTKKQDLNWLKEEITVVGKKIMVAIMI